jgi:Phage capsid protein
MADAIPLWQISQFTNTVEHKLQATGGRLRGAVTYHSGYTGKQASPVNYVGETEPVEVNERFGDTPNMELNHERRWIKPRKFHWGKLVETDDELFTGIQPQGAYTEAAVKGFQRVEDLVILSAFYATAYTGEAGETTEAWSDTGYVVDQDVGGANTGLNHAKLKKLRELFTKYDVDLDMEQMYIAISEQEVTDLFGENTTISIDFTEGRPISTGKLPPLYGFNFVPFSSRTIERVTGLKVASLIRTLPVWVKSGMHLGSWKDRNVEIMKNPSKQMKPQIYMSAFYNATRLQLGKVLKVKTYHA